MRPGLLAAVLGVFFPLALSGPAFGAPSPWPSSKWPGAEESGAPTASPTAEVRTFPPAGTPSGAPTPTASPSPVVEKLRPIEQKQLLREFKKAQKVELDALRHRQKLELRELKASQTARSREWKRKENARRHELFAGSLTPQERREYFKDRQERWDAYRRLLTDEITRRQGEQKARYQAAQEDQAHRLREFNFYLEKMERPPASLWPQNNY